ncbi:MAG: hypothetical protein CMF22_10025 [Idiomarinaceae bacterium]|nr:hypothetical protein [Idiomarinaceae bacterium]|tara:strand:+ start:60690 stop:61160 length:471 start_codon:yes stop_codon:yes gene_type:complete
MKLATFSPKDIVFSINDYLITDFANGTFININKNSPNFMQVRGIRGKHTRVRTRDRSGSVTFSLMQTSNQNDLLSELAYQDDVNQTGHLLLTIRDVGGQTSLQFGNAYLASTPNLSYGAASTTPREWTINFEFITTYEVGGNERSPFDILDNLNIF